MDLFMARSEIHTSEQAVGPSCAFSGEEFTYCRGAVKLLVSSIPHMHYFVVHRKMTVCLNLLVFYIKLACLK